MTRRRIGLLFTLALDLPVVLLAAELPLPVPIVLLHALGLSIYLADTLLPASVGRTTEGTAVALAQLRGWVARSVP